MSTRIIPIAAVLFAFAAPAVAETPAANVERALGMEPGAMQQVMDQAIFATPSLISSRAAGTAATPNSAGTDRARLAPITTSCRSSPRVHFDASPMRGS